MEQKNYDVRGNFTYMCMYEYMNLYQVFFSSDEREHGVSLIQALVYSENLQRSVSLSGMLSTAELPTLRERNIWGYLMAI